MTYPAINFKHPVTIVFSIIFLGILSLLIFIAIISTMIIWKLLFFFLSIIIFLLIISLTTSKIIINEKNIVKKTLFFSKSIDFIEIKKIGVYLSGPGANYLRKEDYDKNYWFDQKLIFISKSVDYDPKFTVSQRGTIKCQYIKILFEEIENQVGTS